MNPAIWKWMQLKVSGFNRNMDSAKVAPGGLENSTACPDFAGMTDSAATVMPDLIRHPAFT
jgi:hypothetical protein